MARPTKYKKEYNKKVDAYLKKTKDSFTADNKLSKVDLPTIGGFARYIDVPERTLYDWRDAHAEFSQSLAKIVQEQKKRLLNMGLSGEYNSTIAKLVLSSNHGMSEKQDVDMNLKAKVEMNITDEEFEDVLDDYAKRKRKKDSSTKKDI